ncbi:hypothetical protein [Stenotrophomonas maltophilia]|uniref:hypothetical protein n=1 Tax=Stenotrophomonas maltophilia TaxID=40324 RepID=UPI0002B8BE89|nr:hypothetical protein [Stenotrophomonas maltophilia]EMF59749.1 Hypothetical protein EPM1_3456 [Stenotrophomonas maltophilia EPM1]
MNAQIIAFPAGRIVRLPSDRGDQHRPPTGMSEERLRALAARMVEAMRAQESRA